MNNKIMHKSIFFHSLSLTKCPLMCPPFFGYTNLFMYVHSSVSAFIFCVYAIFHSAVQNSIIFLQFFLLIVVGDVLFSSLCSFKSLHLCECQTRQEVHKMNYLYRTFSHCFNSSAIMLSLLITLKTDIHIRIRCILYHCVIGV